MSEGKRGRPPSAINTADGQQLFCRAVEGGASVAEAAKAIGCSLRTVERRLKTDAQLREDVEAAVAAREHAAKAERRAEVQVADVAAGRSRPRHPPRRTCTVIVPEVLPAPHRIDLGPGGDGPGDYVRMTVAEFDQILDTAVRDPDHPSNALALRLRFEQLHGPSIAGARKRAELRAIAEAARADADGEQPRVLVLRLPEVSEADR